MHRDKTRTAHPLVIVALVMLIAAGSAITAVAGSTPEDFADEAGGEAQAFPATLSIRLAADTPQGHYQPFPDSTGGSSRAKAQ